MNMVFNIEDKNEFVISDTHFYHNNIVKYCQRPGFDGRNGRHDFNEHNKIMERNWHSIIRPTDKVLHLGDLAFFPSDYDVRQECKELIKNLPGDKYIILGNHDESAIATYNELGFTVIEPFEVDYRGYKVSFDHYPKEKFSPKEVRIHGHTHNNSVDRLDKRNLNVCVELRSFSPQPLRLMVDSAIFAAEKDDFSRDFGVVQKRKRAKL